MDAPVLADEEHLQQLFTDTVGSLEDLTEAMDDMKGWGERESQEIYASSTAWWWKLYIYIYIYRERERERIVNII